MEKIEPPEPYKMSLVEFELPLRGQGQDPPTQYLCFCARRLLKMHLAYIDTFFHILKIGLEIRLKAGKPPEMRRPTFTVFVSPVRF